MLRASFLLLAAVSFAVPLHAERETGAPAAPDSWRGRLVELVQAAVSRNPDLRAMKLRVDAARLRVPQADALPEPELELGLRDLPVESPSLTRDDFTMEMVTLRQALPGRGKRAARRALAMANVEGEEARYRGHVLAITAEVADSFFAVAGIDRRLAIAEDSRRRLERAAAAATERFRVGQGGQADVLRASLESTRLEETILGLRAERASRAARLNALLGEAAQTPVPSMPPLSRDLDAELTVPPIAELGRLAAELSSVVRAAEAALAAADVEVDLASLERRPDWTLSSYYGRRERFEDLVGASVALSLPWARRSRLAQRGAEEETERAAAHATVAAVRARLLGEIGEAYAELEKSRQQLRLYRDVILPQAEIHLEAAREAYTVGRVDFLTFVSAASELDTYQQAAADRATSIGHAVAALQRASGLPLLPGVPPQGENDEAR